MKRNMLCLLLVVSLLTSCIVKKDYINRVVKEGEITSSKSKSVVLTGFDNIDLNSFKKTFAKNYPTNNEFIEAYISEFITESKKSGIYGNYKVEVDDKWKELDKGINADRAVVDELFSNANADYVITFSNFEITNRIETSYRAPISNNPATATHNSKEYCVLDVEVSIYDTQTKKRILKFVTTGESSVFLFNFSQTLLKAKKRSIQHIINYIKSGRITYNKY